LSKIKELCPGIAVHSSRHCGGTLPWLKSNGSPAERIPFEVIQAMQQSAEEMTMSNGKSASEKDYAALEADFIRLREDVASLTETVKKVAAHEARGMADAMRDGIDGAAERVRKAGKRAKNSAQDAAESLQASVEEHPIQSVLVALGLGVVVGMLLRR
jgi:ElaB/YqjD/DUF883 family membrane-anchored ribosome-binding protein